MPVKTRSGTVDETALEAFMNNFDNIGNFKAAPPEKKEN